MALSWHAQGPTVLQLSVNPSDATFVDFARTDNDDLCGFEIEDHQQAFKRNDLGDMTAEVIETGSTCRIEFTATSWDEALYENLMGWVRLGSTTSAASNEGKYAQVGKLLVTDSRTFSLKILTSRSGEKSYTFKYCRIVAHRVRSFGNTMKQLIMILESLPDTATGRIYTPSTNS